VILQTQSDRAGSRFGSATAGASTLGGGPAPDASLTACVVQHGMTTSAGQTHSTIVVLPAALSTRGRRPVGATCRHAAVTLAARLDSHRAPAVAANTKRGGSGERCQAQLPEPYSLGQAKAPRSGGANDRRAGPTVWTTQHFRWIRRLRCRPSIPRDDARRIWVCVPLRHHLRAASRGTDAGRAQDRDSAWRCDV
jgi:hypothetical protein